MKRKIDEWDDVAWATDIALNHCTPATRGVWKDLLTAMRLAGCTGELRGTVEQLAVSARCSAADLSLALTDLQTTGAADVSVRNGVVTVVNRRMSRKEKKRQADAARQLKHRQGCVSHDCHAEKTGHQNENQCDAPVCISTPLEESNSSREKKPLRNKFIPPTLDEVRSYFREKGTHVDPELFFNHYEANGWVQGSRAKPVVNWKACLVTWERNPLRGGGGSQKTFGGVDPNAFPE